MILKDYHNPSDEELEVAFREIYHFVGRFPITARLAVWLICRVMGDRLYKLVAQEMHSKTMQTLHHVRCGMHADYFKRQRIERAQRDRDARDWVPSEIVE